ncbi:hypothetical protein EJB05_20459, partial [Eragrostis curvula]
MESLFITNNVNYIIEMFLEDGVRDDLHDFSGCPLRITGVIEHAQQVDLGHNYHHHRRNKDDPLTIIN